MSGWKFDSFIEKFISETITCKGLGFENEMLQWTNYRNKSLWWLVGWWISVITGLVLKTFSISISIKNPVAAVGQSTVGICLVRPALRLTKYPPFSFSLSNNLFGPQPSAGVPAYWPGPMSSSLYFCRHRSRPLTCSRLLAALPHLPQFYDVCMCPISIRLKS